MRMKKRFITIGIVLILVALYVMLLARNNRDDARREVQLEQEQRARVSRQERRQAAFDARVSEMAQRYNAVADWNKTLPSAAYSVEVEKSMVRADHPLLVNAWIEDVTNTTQAQVHLGSDDVPGRVQLVLDADNVIVERLHGSPRTVLPPRSGSIDSQIEAILRKNRTQREGIDDDVRYTFVVTVASVHKSTVSRYAFIASGKLLDFTFTGEAEPGGATTLGSESNVSKAPIVESSLPASNGK